MSTEFEKEALSVLGFGGGGKTSCDCTQENFDLLNSTVSKKIFSTGLKRNADEDETLDNRIQKSVRSYMEDGSVDMLAVAAVGVASLQLFVQSNWTGPPLRADRLLPWLGQDRPPESEVLGSLVLDGEGVHSAVRHPLLLLLARGALGECARARPCPLGVRWWWQRCTFVHQQVLDEYSVTLHGTLMALLDETLAGDLETLREDVRTAYRLEAAQVCLYYSQVLPAKLHVDAAAQECGLQLELKGALGKRTKFQEKAVAQLKLQVSVERPNSVLPIRPQFLPKDLNLDDEVRLNQVNFLNEADGEYPVLTPLEQAVVLSKFIHTQKSQPKDKVAEEELLPYLSCLLANPQSWSLQMAALLFRSRLESSHSRTVERSMMQVQELAGCLEAALPTFGLRASTLFVSYLPPHWRIQADMANLLFSMGNVKSALDIYLQLDLWEEVVNCYNLLQQRHLAAEIIREKLNAGETVKLWCLLGDATDDVSCYEKAWELSGHKSGRAQRHWALFYFRRRYYAESIPHLQASLALNSLQLTLWFQLGFACLDQGDWQLCATAYRRYCALDPENFEAWNNLAKAYVKTGQKARAWKVLQEAVKCNYENWHVWDNLLVVSTDCGEFEEVIHSYHRLLDLKKRHLDLEVLKILVNAIAKDLPDSKGIPAGRYRKNALQLFGRLTGQITDDAVLWQLYARLTASAPEQSPPVLRSTVLYLQKALTHAVRPQAWARDVAQCRSVAGLCILLADACLEFCKNSPKEAVSMLTSTKLSLKGVLTKIKQKHLDVSTETVTDDLKPTVTQLEEKMTQVMQEIQHLGTT
ncbi:tetratricopeptide repeat protein 27 [Bacillus rossius redtenbacheri]|uniref:tetratricopeptide repeat protein 27 n=1 Tax=Bacillus rossius redtenbacheri TaxID=93214 RepID=UPI002FDCADD9